MSTSRVKNRRRRARAPTPRAAATIVLVVVLAAGSLAPDPAPSIAAVSAPTAGALTLDASRPALAPRTSPAPALADTGSTGSIVGRVRTARGPAAFAFARVDGPRRLGSSTDSAGNFRIDGVPAGVRMVTVQSLGYRPWTGIVRVRAGATDSIECALESHESPCFEQPAPSAECIEQPAEELARVGRRCSRHAAARLEPDTVRIAYGLLVARLDFDAAKRRNFPNARTSWEGGCVTQDRSPAWALVAFCRECRLEQAAWLAEARSARGRVRR